MLPFSFSPKGVARGRLFFSSSLLKGVSTQILLPLLPFPSDRVKQCHESEDKVAQRNVVVQNQLMIDSRGSCIAGRLTQPVHVMRVVARHQQFIHSVCTELFDLNRSRLPSARAVHASPVISADRALAVRASAVISTDPSFRALAQFAHFQ